MATKKKSKVKGGSVHEIDEINDKYFDENLHNNNHYMGFAMYITSDGKTVESNAIQDLKEFNSQPLSTQTRKGGPLVSILPAIEKTFDLKGDDLVELSTENKSLKNQIGSHDEKLFEESKAEQLKQIDDDKRANSFMSRKRKQMQKQKLNDKYQFW